MDLSEFLALNAEQRAAHIAGLSGEDLAALMTALEAHFADLDGQPATADVIDAQADVVAATQLARTENANRIEAEQQAEARRAELRGQMQAPAAEGEEPPAEETPAADGEPAAVEEPQAVAAAAAPAAAPAQRTPARRAPLAAMTQRQPATAQPRPEQPAAITASLTVADGVPGFIAGRQLDPLRLGQAAVARLNAVDEFDSNGKFSIAQVAWEFPEDRRLKAGASDDNTRKVERLTNRDAMVAAAAAFLATDPSDAEAITAAAGGFCAPFPVDYNIPTEGDIARPVRDSMARFGADRGGINFTTPPVLSSDPTVNGVGLWTAADDAAVTLDGATGVYTAPKTKPIVEYQCLGETTESVYAVTLRQSFSNFTARFNPEQAGAYMRLGLVNQARLGEIRLLQAMYDRMDYRVTQAKVLGAARDWFATLDTVLPQARARHRLGRTYPYRAYAPSYLMDMLRADFVRQMPAVDLNIAMALADATVLAWARTRNVNITWTLDDRVATASYGRTQATQNTSGIGTAVLLDFPDTIEWMLVPEGAFQFLDGGTLDLGVVRDTRTNAVNRFETFTETFEGVAKRTPGGYVITSTLQPTGQAAGLTDTSALDL